MNDIDWEKFANDNGLSIEDFKEEITTAFFAFCAIDIDSNDSDALTIGRQDSKGEIKAVITRVSQ